MTSMNKTEFFTVSMGIAKDMLKMGEIKKKHMESIGKVLSVLSDVMYPSDKSIELFAEAQLLRARSIISDMPDDIRKAAEESILQPHVVKIEHGDSDEDIEKKISKVLDQLKEKKEVN